MSQYLDSFIASLPPNTKSYPYKGLQDLWTQVEQRQRQEGPAEMGHMNLMSVLFVKLSGMGDANMTLKPTGSKEYQTPTRTKRADQSFKPRGLPQGRSEFWPSLVMESGWSESKLRLQDDASWFLTESAGDVKVALTISINQKVPEIVINKWDPEAAPSIRSRVQPFLAQQIVISKTKGQPANTATIEGAPLVIPFEDLSFDHRAVVKATLSSRTRT